ncbi:hypothetical protein ENSA7_48840 [Enhygromyxa salina]|uniref:Uncharacterized protein n=1 Tax=Enhygromyxa salina TaxID=215803 RepID=A0A2S9YIL5_9BACT|nr:hypothetical protein ENSA7_48840 [Enhygromyxa salina]
MARLNDGQNAHTEDRERPLAADPAPVAAPKLGLNEGSSGPNVEPDNSLKYVFSAIALISVVVGVLGYWRYANSERWVAQGISNMDAVGATLDAEGCVDEVVGWYGACDQHDANAAVCLQGVGILMQHCLSARERDETCEQYLDPTSDKHAASDDMLERARNPATAGGSGRWVYARCEERGMVCRNKRECACAEAYRAIDSFCRTGQSAVQL